MYGHMSRLLAAEGDEVQAGQVIGLSGNSGRSTAPHLHFEIRHDGKSVDPLDLVKVRTRCWRRSRKILLDAAVPPMTAWACCRSATAAGWWGTFLRRTR